jgi:hypothetical protein
VSLFTYNIRVVKVNFQIVSTTIVSSYKNTIARKEFYLKKLFQRNVLTTGTEMLVSCKFYFLGAFVGKSGTTFLK